MVLEIFKSGSIKMNKKELAQWKPTASMTVLAYDSLAAHYNLWNLANEILAAGEITDDLFKRIGEELANKILLWRSIEAGVYK